MAARSVLPALLALLLLSASTTARAVDNALLTYCKADIERLCAGIEPGGGRLLQCLKGHKEEMSVGCAQALMKLKSKLGK
jgi:hypothetical protein